MSDPRRSRSSAARLFTALAAAVGLAGAVATGCGTDDAVVGGVCADGYTECSLACVDLQNDPSNCGACGMTCAPRVQCVGGVCGGTYPSDATVGDGHVDGETFDANDLDGPYGNCDANDPNLVHCHPVDGATDATGDGARADGATDGGDANAGDANASDANAADGSTTDGGNTDASTTDASATDASDGAVDAGLPDACPPPPYNTPTNCGGCGIPCGFASPICSLVNGSYACVPLCTPPLTDCNGRCVNLLRDPGNCGACGNVCPSNYCLLATCQGQVAGNVVVLGHDYKTTAPNEQQAKLLTNSVFYNSTTSVRLFSFEHYANPAVVTNVKKILNAYATTHNVALAINVSNTDSDVPNGALTPATEDVLLVYDQPTAPPGTMATLGASWAASMSAFTLGGGIVIVLDGAQGTAEMPAFETSGALLTVTSHQAIAGGSPIDITTPGDAIARGMTSVYIADDNSAAFVTAEPASATLFYTATDRGTGQLTAVHKVVQ